MSAKNIEYLLAERPVAEIVPGRTLKRVETDRPTAADLKEGQFIVEVYYLSLDPAMRTWIEDVPLYMPIVEIGERMRGYSVCKVIASKNPNVKEGETVMAFSGWTQYAVLDDEKSIQPIQVSKNIEVTDALGTLGIPGLTAYFGVKHVGQPKAGETVVVSGAAGATGSVVGQICKIKGCRVIGIAGTDAKCEVLTKEMGFDVALNYKSPTFREDFIQATPDLIDMFWDNVGGEILEAALDRAALRSRFVECGSVTGYNNVGLKSQVGIRNLVRITIQRIRMEGVLVLDYMHEAPEALAELSGWITEGKIKSKKTVIQGGIEIAEHAIGDLFAGKNTGKMLVEVKPYPYES